MKTLCDCDKVYSGELRGQRYRYICRRCGTCGWSREYVIPQVDAEEYLALRVTHGWMTPVIPRAPRVPTQITPERRSVFAPPMLLSGALVALIGMAGIRWRNEGALLAPVAALIGSGVALGVFTVFYVLWKRDS